MRPKLPYRVGKERLRDGGAPRSAVLRVLPEPGEAGELLVEAGVLLDLLAAPRDLHLDLVLLLLLVERRLAAERRRRVRREVRHVLLVGGERRRVPRARRDRPQRAPADDGVVVVEQPATVGGAFVGQAGQRGGFSLTLGSRFKNDSCKTKPQL